MGKRILGKSVTDADITSDAVPSGLVGIDMTLFLGQAKPQWWLVTLDVQNEADDFFIWGAKAVSDDPADDVWGLHQDEFATFPLGAIGTLDPGRYTFMVDGLGLYSRVAITTGGATQKASLDLGTLGTGALDTVVEAQVAGSAGELITITLIGDSAPAGGVTIDEVGDDVTIHYESQVSTVADVETAITSDSTLVEVKTAGTAGTVLDATDDQFSGGTLSGGSDAIKSSLNLATKTTHCSTVIQESTPGAAGDGTSIEFVADGTGVGTLDESGYPAIVFHFETAVTTVANFETKVAASVNLEVKTASGSPSTALVVIVDEFTATNLAGGADAVKATGDMSTEADGQWDSVVRAKTAGVGGNNITVELVGDSVSGVTIDEVGDAVTIHFENHVSTVDDIETVITSTSDVLEIDTPGTAGNVLDVDGESFGPVSLVGGTAHVDFTLSEILESGRGN